MSGTQPKKRLRWFQYSLRSLLLLTLLVSVGMSWIMYRVRKAERQRRAVQAIEALGGQVHYEYQYVGEDHRYNYKSIRPQFDWWRPEWLVERLGYDFFYRVEWANVWTDEGVKHLRGLPDLRSITLVRFTRASPLAWWLRGDSSVTDDGLAYLKEFSQLRHLCGPPSVLRYLRDLPQLQSLSLNGTKTTDADLQHLSQAPQLQQLGLRYTEITDKGLECLTPLTKLKGLHLRGTRITDAGLRKLMCLVNLESLELDRTSITADGFEMLKNLPHLRWLGVGDKQVTEDGVKKLQQTLPNCEIDRLYHNQP
jgi:hypothetical protein